MHTRTALSYTFIYIEVSLKFNHFQNQVKSTHLILINISLINVHFLPVVFQSTDCDKA